MQKLERYIKNLFFKNNFIIFLSFLILIKPYFLGVNFFVNVIVNVLLLVIAGIVYFLSFYKNKISKLQKAIFLFMGISFLSTLITSHDMSHFFKYFIQYSTISLYTELLIKNSLPMFLKNVSILLYALIVANFVTILLYPNGFFKPEVFLLGYDNATIVTMLLGSMFLIFTSNYFYQKAKFWAIVPFVITIISYYIRWSVGAMIGCIILLLYFIIFYRKPKFTKYLNIRTFYWGAFILFLLIVVFGIQNYFSFIIEDVFHKSLTLTGRTTIWQNCFDQILHHPILGIGMMDYQTRFSTLGIYHAHCTFLNVVLESGLVGLFSYFYLWHLIIKALLIHKENKMVNLFSFTFLSYLIMTLVDVIDNAEVLFVFYNLAYFSSYILRQMVPQTKKKKILLVLDSGQPLPAIMGGAVETLTDYYLNENEKTGKYIFDVFSTYHSKLKKISVSKKYVHFYYIKKNTVSFQLKRVGKKIYQKVTHKKLASVFSYELLDRIEMENKQNYYDLVLIENSPAVILNLKRIVSGKYVLHLHNDISIISHEQHCLEMYDQIISCSNFIKNRVLEYYLKCKVTNVYNGVDEKSLLKYQARRNELRREFHFDTDTIVFGYCGRICQEKGVRELIQAFKSVSKSYSNIKLVIAGSSFFKDSKQTPFIKELIEEVRDIQDKVIFTGYIDHDEIGKFFAIIDVSVHPSIVNEACPLSVIEAEIMGLPILGSSSGGIPELVLKDCSLLVERNHLKENLEVEMTRILKKPKLLQNMSKSSLKNSKKFYLNNYVKNYYRELDRIISRGLKYGKN